ncbi:MAG: hypothetical protein ACPG4T_16590, partial [Nannocystaceae bacterium]
SGQMCEPGVGAESSENDRAAIKEIRQTRDNGDFQAATKLLSDFLERIGPCVLRSFHADELRRHLGDARDNDVDGKVLQEVVELVRRELDAIESSWGQLDEFETQLRSDIDALDKELRKQLPSPPQDSKRSVVEPSQPPQSRPPEPVESPEISPPKRLTHAAIGTGALALGAAGASLGLWAYYRTDGPNHQKIIALSNNLESEDLCKDASDDISSRCRGREFAEVAIPTFTTIALASAATTVTLAILASRRAKSRNSANMSLVPVVTPRGGLVHASLRF